MQQKPAATRKFPHAPVLMLPDVISPDMCKRLIAYWERTPKMTGGVASGTGAAEVNRRVKVRDDVALQDPGLAREMLEAIAGKVIPAVDQVFHYQITEWEALRIGCYDGQDRGFFGAHRDNTTPYTAHRHFAMSLNLNHGEYKGGQLKFNDFMGGPFEPPTGGACIFSCNLLHEALPVTRGRRFGVFCFFFNQAGAAQMRKMHAETIKQQQGQAVPVA
jgi:predicted 2-oxoglutarate/Fe(II)-dependent dioxygenase YbiX